MSDAQHQIDKRLPAEIRRLATRPEVRKSLAASSQFQVEAAIPEAMAVLLDLIDHIDRRTRQGSLG